MSEEHKDVCPDCGADVSDITASLKKALGEEREFRRKAERSLKQAQDANKGIGDQTAKIEELEQAIDALKQQRDADAEELGKAIAERDELKASAEKAEADRATAEKDAAITEELQKAGGNIEALMPHVRSRADAAPERALTDIIGDLRNSDSFASLFRGTGQTGGGSMSEGSSGGKITNITESKNLRRGTMTEREKIDYQREHGIEGLMSLPQ